MNKGWLTLLFIFLLIPPVLNNSGPLSQEGEEGYALIVEENSGVAVLQETLTLDFSMRLDQCQVTANYKMISDRDQIVLMAFPYVGKVDLENPTLLVNEEPIKSTVLSTAFFQEDWQLEQNRDFASLLSFFKEATLPELLDQEVHVVQVDPMQEYTSYEVSLKLSEEDRVYTLNSGFYSIQEEECKVGYSQEGMGGLILISEKPIVLEKVMDTKENQEIHPEMIEHQTTYLQVIKGWMNDTPFNIAEYQWFVKALESTQDRLQSFHDLIAYAKSRTQLSLLIYEVPMEKEVPVSVVVQTQQDVAWKKTKEQTEYTFLYYFSAAQGWEHFDHLNVQVIFPEENHEIELLSSNLDFESKEDLLQVTMDYLPEQNLILKFAKKNPTSEKNFQITLGLGAVVLFLVIMSLWIGVKKHGNKH